MPTRHMVLAVVPWLPIPLFLVLILFLWAAGMHAPHESVFLGITLSFIFSVLASFLAAYLMSRSLLLRGTLGLLALECGLLIWSGAGIMALLAGLMGADSPPEFANISVTIHNCCAWWCGFLSLLASFLLLRPTRSVRETGLWLTAAFAFSVGLVCLIVVWTLGGQMPVFFIQGEGGTPLRQLVLAFSIAMFAGAAITMLVRGQKLESRFLYWYALALLLIAVGLLGVMAQANQGSLLSWAGRGAQYLSGVYLVVAAVAAGGEAHVWNVSLQSNLEETDRRAREILRESEERYRGLVQNTTALILRLDARGAITFANDHALKFFGYTQEELIGQPALGTIVPERETTGRDLAAMITAIVANPDRFHFNTNENMRKNGERVWIEWTNSGVYNNRGHLVEFLAVGIDATERKRTEEALRERGESLRRLAENVPCVLMRFDRNLRVVYLSPQSEQYNPVPVKDMLGRTNREVGMPEALCDRWDAASERVFRTGNQEEMEFQLAGPSGMRTFALRLAPEFGPDNEVRYVLGVSSDITERKAAEAAMRASELKYRRLHESMRDAFVAVDMAGRIQEHNAAYRDLLGYTDEELRQLTYQELTPPQWHAFEARIVAEEILATGCSGVYEKEYRRKDGTALPVELRTQLIRDEAGRPHQMWAVVRDITARRQAEDALRESEARRRTAEAIDTERRRLYDVLETLPVMVCLLTQDYHVAFANRAFRDKFGESNGRHCHEYCFGLAQPCDFCQSYRVLETRRPQRWEVTAPDGTVIEAHDFPFADIDGSPMILEMDIDVTEIKKAQAALRKMNESLEERVAARTSALQASEDNLRRLVKELERSNQDLEQFAYISSHDLQEPLRQVSGFVELLRKNYSNLFDDQARLYMGFITEGTVRMSRLIKDLLAYSRIGRSDRPPERVNLTEVVQQALKTLRLRMEETGAVIAVSPLPVVAGNPVALGQLFQNLLANALKFVREEPPQIEIDCRRQDDQWLFSVRDNGIGFASGSRERIFEVFKRLHGREEYEGTGIGLSICKRVVELHGGQIWAESEPGKGSTFYFTLPAEE